MADKKRGKILGKPLKNLSKVDKKKANHEPAVNEEKGQNGQRPAPNPSSSPQPSQEPDEEFVTVAEYHAKVNALAIRLSSVETGCADYCESLEFTQGQVADLREEKTDLCAYFDSLELEINRNAYALHKIEAKQDKLEITSKKSNLVLDGVPETVGGKRKPA